MLKTRQNSKDMFKRAKSQGFMQKFAEKSFEHSYQGSSYFNIKTKKIKLPHYPYCFFYTFPTPEYNILQTKKNNSKGGVVK